MAKSSRLFHIAVITLVIAIIGLVAAIYFQRQSASRAQLKERLLLDGQRIEAISEKAKLITPHIPMLEQQAQTLEQQFQGVVGRLYKETDRPAIESFLNQIARTSQLDLAGIEDVTVEEGPLFKEHVLNVRMTGPMKNLPVWADKFFSQEKIVRVDRVSVVSPDYKFQKVKLKATIRLFEPNDPMTVAPGEIDFDRFGVDLSYVPPDADTEDPEYGAALREARSKAEELDALKKDLASAEILERKIAGLQKLLAGTQSLVNEMETNRRTVMENLPTLYIRVRNSPLGSAALTVQGDQVRFPEIAGDD